jgi:hypothetical protein
MIASRLLLIAAALLAATSVLAQKKANVGAAYRCVDAQGRTHMGDSVPPECLGADVQVLNARGRVIRVIEGESARAARLEREAAQESERIAQEERAQKDRVLLDTYSSVDDIERLRDQRLDLLDSQITVTHQSMDNLRERQERLEQQIQRFRPYSDNPNAPPVPDHLAEDMVNTVNSLNVYQQQIEEKQAEKEQLRGEFAADIARFRKLKTQR